MQLSMTMFQAQPRQASKITFILDDNTSASNRIALVDPSS